MFKRVLSIVLCAFLLFSFSACTKTVSPELPYYNYDLSSYLTLGEYKGMKVDKFMTEATETEIGNMVNEYMEVTDFYLAVTDRPSQKGDFVDLTCNAMIDGEYYEEGSASFTAELGNSTFMEGFEEGLYDKKAGDHVTLNLTYPEDYSDTNVAGKPVVFEIDIEEIKIAVEPELSDEFLAAHTEHKTVEALRESLKAEIEQSKAASETSMDQQNLVNKLLEISNISSLPEQEIQRYEEKMTAYKAQLESTASLYGMDLDSYVKIYSNNTYENYEALQDDRIDTTIRTDMIFAQIAKNENITWDPNAYEELLNNYSSQGYQSKEEFLQNTNDGVDIQWVLLCNAVIDYMMDNAVFVDPDGNTVVRATPTPVPTTVVSPSPEE